MVASSSAVKAREEEEEEEDAPGSLEEREDQGLMRP